MDDIQMKEDGEEINIKRDLFSDLSLVIIIL